MNKVNVCFLTDEGYCMQTSVAITSMLKNKNMDSEYDIYILCDNVTNESKNNFKKLETEKFKIYIIDLDNNDEYNKYEIKDIPATITAMHKFSIPNILSNLDKVLYLDGDIIVKKDLAELYNFDIGNNYVGAVKEAGGMSRTQYNLFIKKNVFYFNSGVMLMNLKKMRDDNISEKLIDYRINGYNELMDQDSLNYVLKDKSLELPFKFNTQLVFLYICKSIFKIKKFYSIDNKIATMREILDYAVVVHYSGKKKPWKHFDGYEHDLWMYYYYLSPYKEKPLIRQIYCANKNKRIIGFIENKRKNLRRYTFMKKFAK